MKSKGGEKEK